MKELDLTIVIPTFERQQIIKNLAEFYNKKPYKVLILDGSKKSLNFTFPSNVHYIWSGKTYLERLKSSSKYIQTNYVCMAGDDEFQFIEALSRSIEFLESNKNYSSCSGYPVSYYASSYRGIKKLTGFDAFFSSRLTNKTPYIYDNKCYSNLEISRIKEHFSYYCNRFIYSVTRKNIWNAAINAMAIASEELNLRGLYELVMEYSIIGAGPVNLINIPMWYVCPLIQNADSPIQIDESLNTKNPHLHEIWKNIPETKKKKLIERLNEAIRIIDFKYLDNSFNIYSEKIELKKLSRHKIYRNKFERLPNYFFSLKKRFFTLLIIILFKFKKSIAISLLASGLKISKVSKIELKKYLSLITKKIFK